MKYNIGDKVRIKSLDWYNQNKDELGDIDYGKMPFMDYMSEFCNRIVTISNVNYEDECYEIEEDGAANSWTDEMIEGLVEEDNTDCEKCSLTRNSTRCLFMDNCLNNKQKNIIEVPEDYVLKDENGNIINATKIVLEKKKKEYPKTYEECCDILQLEHTFELNDLTIEEETLFKSFIQLKRCRDAYWKIAGDEMGLDKPWKPDWREKRYIIYQNQDDIIGGYREAGYVEHHTFEFPKPEMRDAFKENFGPDIENCKEFL